MSVIRVPALLLVLAFCAATEPQEKEKQERRKQGAVPEGSEVERNIEYGKVGEHALKLDLYKPRETPEEPMPAVVWIHGGGWRGGDKQPPGPAVQLAARGYVVISINYRLSGVAPFPAAVEDCKSAVRWLRANAKKYTVDPDRIGVWGSSAGGHLSLMVGCADESAKLEGSGGHEKTSSRVQAVCSWFGPTDFTKGHKEFQSGRGGAPLKFLGGTYDEKPGAYRQASPITHASKDDPPVLMVHGDKDKVVPLEQSESMHTRLKELGVDSTLVTVKNGTHGFQGDSDPPREELIKISMDFFDKHLRPKKSE